GQTDAGGSFDRVCGIEQAKLDVRRVLREHGEVDALAVPGGTQRVGAARAHRRQLDGELFFTAVNEAGTVDVEVLGPARVAIVARAAQIGLQQLGSAKVGTAQARSPQDRVFEVGVSQV